MAALLPSLLHLRSFSLDEHLPSLSSLDFLAQLPALTEIEIGSRAGNADALLQSLSVTLPRVATLHLNSSALNSDQLKVLLTRFPQLRELTLGSVGAFDSLSFLEPVRGTLSSLSLRRCHGFEITANTLLVLCPFGLTNLKVHRRYGGALDDSLVRSLTPPSTLLPTLQEFEYIAPGPH